MRRYILALKRNPKIRKILRSIVVITLIILIGLHTVNPNQMVRLSPKKHDLVSVYKQETEHIIMYGGDAEFAEKIYIELQLMFGAFYVNKRAKIYVANPKPKWGTGIGYVSGVVYSGIYRPSVFGPDVIIYNGDPQTLVHELVHLFAYNMKKGHVSEILARMVPNFQELTAQHKALIQAVMKSGVLNGQKDVQKTTQAPENTVKV